MAAHARIQSSAFARVMLRALEGSFVVFSTLRSVHLAVRLVAVVARRFVRVETGLVAGAILPKDRFAFEGVGLAVVVGGHAFGGALISRLGAWAWARAEGLGCDLIGADDGVVSDGHAVARVAQLPAYFGDWLPDQ